jgi:Uri superfamily endonuclease
MCKQLGSQVPVFGFGSSDCRYDCDSHLIFFHQRPVLKTLSMDEIDGQ